MLCEGCEWGDPCVGCASLCDNGFVFGVTVMGVWLACLSAGMQVCGWGCWDWLLTVAGAGVAYVHVRFVESVHVLRAHLMLLIHVYMIRSATDEGQTHELNQKIDITRRGKPTEMSKLLDGGLRAEM